MTKDKHLGYYNDYANVIDYIEIKMHSMANQYTIEGKAEIAEKLWLALDMYLDHKAAIWFEKGEPVMRKYTDAELIENSKQVDDKDDEASP
tara:strand:+ start:345 stop:617 length:273 start_codon:yes stop_codon:yes gene_type:complete